MHVTTVQHPWQHYLIDDFLPESDYQHLLDWFSEQPAMNNEQRKKSDRRWKDDRYPKSITESLYTSFLEVMSYTQCTKPGIVSYQLDKMLPNECDYPTHCDAFHKIASLVLYVGEPNRGTFIHASDTKEPSYEVEWKENRAFFFIVQQGVSWHSFHNQGTTTPRCTALINLRQYT